MSYYSDFSLGAMQDANNAYDENRLSPDCSDPPSSSDSYFAFTQEDNLGINEMLFCDSTSIFEIPVKSSVSDDDENYLSSSCKDLAELTTEFCGMLSNSLQTHHESFVDLTPICSEMPQNDSMYNDYYPTHQNSPDMSYTFKDINFDQTSQGISPEWQSCWPESALSSSSLSPGSLFGLEGSLDSTPPQAHSPDLSLNCHFQQLDINSPVTAPYPPKQDYTFPDQEPFASIDPLCPSYPPRESTPPHHGNQTPVNYEPTLEDFILNLEAEHSPPVSASSRSPMSRDPGNARNSPPPNSNHYERGNNRRTPALEDLPKEKIEMLLTKIPVPGTKRIRGPKVYEFLRRLLNEPLLNPLLIKWENELEGTFRLVDPQTISKIWGKRTKRKGKALSYDNFARNLRYHYKTKNLINIADKQLVYGFGKFKKSTTKH